MRPMRTHEGAVFLAHVFATCALQCVPTFVLAREHVTWEVLNSRNRIVRALQKRKSVELLIYLFY